MRMRKILTFDFDIVKSGPSVTIPSSVSASSTFCDLFENIWMVKAILVFKFTPEDISTVCIAKDSSFSISSQDVKIHHEVAVCQMFDSKYVCFHLKSDKQPSGSAS